MKQPSTRKKSPTRKKLPSRPAKKRTNPAFDREHFHLPIRAEAEQMEGLSEDLVETWRALKRFLFALGEQKFHTSHRSMMFTREKCYAFVRPKKSSIELNFFLTRPLDSELLAKSEAVSKVRYCHVFRLLHSDHVSEPLTDWLREAFEIAGPS